MRRIALATMTLVLTAIVVAPSLAGSSTGTSVPYEVRAIFDNAASAVQGEDVRIAGANVGTINSLDVTPDKRAAVTLEIDDARFTPWHADATCAIRLQSLIGEKYIDCDPGTSAAPALPRIASGPGHGTYLLPVTRTSSPVESDIVQDIYQLPIRQRFALILDEFGTALAARGSDLNEVIHRANPALGYTDQVFQILARENRDLAQLAVDSDTVLRPLAQVRRAIADFVVQANTASVASASRAQDISRSFKLLPSFLRQLRPLMAALGRLADEGTPLMADLSRSAAGIDRQFQNLGPFATAARPALIALGNSSAKSTPALIATEPLARRLDRLGTQGEPAGTLLDRLTASLDQTGAIEQFMALLFYGTAAANGFDSAGHYVRAEPLVGGCTAYVVHPILGCSSNFQQGQGAASASVATKLRRVAAQAAQAVDARQPAAPTLKGLLLYLTGAGR